MSQYGLSNVSRDAYSVSVQLLTRARCYPPSRADALVGINTFNSSAEAILTASPPFPLSSTILGTGTLGPDSSNIAPVTIYGSTSILSPWGSGSLLASPSTTFATPDGFSMASSIEYTYGAGSADTIGYTVENWGSTADLQLTLADGTFVDDIGLRFESVAQAKFRAADYHVGGFWDGVTYPPPSGPPYPWEGLPLGTLELDATITFLVPPTSGPATTSWVEYELHESQTGTTYTYNSLTDTLVPLTILNNYDYTLTARTFWIVPHGVDPTVRFDMSFSLSRLDQTSAPEPGLSLAAAIAAGLAGVRARRRA